MANDPNRRLLTVGQAAEYLGITLRELEMLIRAGRIRACRTGDHWRLDKTEIDAWLDALESRSRDG
jgi:excisionase family DNA binding protein